MPDGWPWTELQPSTRDALLSAGLDTVEKIAALSYREIARRAGIGKWKAQQVRKLIPTASVHTGKAPDPGLPAVPMRRQPHGGALRTGNPGNTGPPPSTIRTAFRKAAADGPAVLAAIMAHGETTPADRMRAAEIAAKFGLGLPKAEDALTIEQVQELVRTLADATVPFVDDESVPALERAWQSVLGERLPEQ